MRNDDVALIQRILAGDENAFESLVRKYQKQVHALAFRKVGNFQTAEDITQETFLRVYQKLATLNDPTKFSGWLYAIVNHLCIAWHRKKPVTNRVAARDPYFRNRDRCVFSICRI